MDRGRRGCVRRGQEFCSVGSSPVANSQLGSADRGDERMAFIESGSGPRRIPVGDDARRPARGVQRKRLGDFLRASLAGARRRSVFLSHAALHGLECRRKSRWWPVVGARKDAPNCASTHSSRPARDDVGPAPSPSGCARKFVPSPGRRCEQERAGGCQASRHREKNDVKQAQVGFFRKVMRRRSASETQCNGLAA